MLMTFRNEKGKWALKKIRKFRVYAHFDFWPHKLFLKSKKALKGQNFKF